MQEDIEKGKIEVAKSKAERDAANALNVLKQDKKRRVRKRDGPSTYYYEDDNRVDLDYATTQKFGILELSPPTELDQLENTNERLVRLRDALKLKGQMEQAEGKARVSKDESYVTGPEYEALKAKFDAAEEGVRKNVQNI